jgi:uncharacterized membrane protein
MATATRTPTRRLTAGGLLLGVGLGGFVDGIVLHQILQWHHLLTSEGSHPADTVAGLEANTLADGLFHAATWIATLAGLLLVWTSEQRVAVTRLLGLMLAGWGAFNLIEGVVDHHLLTLHHVKTGDAELAFDLGFLALGAALLAGGLALARSRSPSGTPSPPPAPSP